MRKRAAALAAQWKGYRPLPREHATRGSSLKAQSTLTGRSDVEDASDEGHGEVISISPNTQTRIDAFELQPLIYRVLDGGQEAWSLKSCCWTPEIIYNMMWRVFSSKSHRILVIQAFQTFSSSESHEAERPFLEKKIATFSQRYSSF